MTPAALAHDGAAALLRLAALRSRLDSDVLDGLAEGSVRSRTTDAVTVSGGDDHGDPTFVAALRRWKTLEDTRRVDEVLRWSATVLPALEARIAERLEDLS